jgi:hypothetical protein
MTSFVALFDTAGVALSAMLCNDGLDDAEETHAEVQEEQLADGAEPHSDSESAELAAPGFGRWWLYGGVAAASLLAALGVCALQRKRRRGQQRSEPPRGAAGSSQAAKSTSRWAPGAGSCMHRPGAAIGAARAAAMRRARLQATGPCRAARGRAALVTARCAGPMAGPAPACSPRCLS